MKKLKQCNDCIWFGSDGWRDFCYNPTVMEANNHTPGDPLFERDLILRCKPEAVLFEPKPTRLQKVWRFIRDVAEGWHT